MLLLHLQYLLSDNEIKIKTALWMAENSDYLKEQKGTIDILLPIKMFYSSSLNQWSLPNVS